MKILVRDGVEKREEPKQKRTATTAERGGVI